MSENTIIPPTVGRVVWYYPTEFDGGLNYHGNEPLAAIVCKVWSERCVNLVVFDANGQTASRSSVALCQPGDATPDGGYCAWMPFQIGQAKKP